MKALFAAVLVLACVAGSTNGFARGGALEPALHTAAVALPTDLRRSLRNRRRRCPPSKAGFPPRSRLPSRPPSSTARCRSPPSAACNGSRGRFGGDRASHRLPRGSWMQPPSCPRGGGSRCRRRALAGGENARTDVRVDRQPRVVVLDSSVTRARKPRSSIAPANMIAGPIHRFASRRQETSFTRPRYYCD